MLKGLNDAIPTTEEVSSDKGFGSGIRRTEINLLSKINPELAKNADEYELHAYRIAESAYRTIVPGAVEFAGQIPTAIEAAAKHPEKIIGSTLVGGTVLASQLETQAKEDPYGFIGSLAGMYIGGKVLSKIPSPLKIPKEVIDSVDANAKGLLETRKVNAVIAASKGKTPPTLVGDIADYGLKGIKSGTTQVKNRISEIPKKVTSDIAGAKLKLADFGIKSVTKKVTSDIAGAKLKLADIGIKSVTKKVTSDIAGAKLKLADIGIKSVTKKVTSDIAGAKLKLADFGIKSVTKKVTSNIAGVKLELENIKRVGQNVKKAFQPLEKLNPDDFKPTQNITPQKFSLRGNTPTTIVDKIAKMENVKNAPKISKINQEINKNYDIIETEEKILNESNLSKANSHYHKMSINAAKMEIKKLTIQKEALGSPSMSMETKVAKLKNVKNAPKISKINQEINKNYDIIETAEKILNESNLSKANSHYHKMSINAAKMEIKKLTIQKEALGSPSMSMETKVAKLKNVKNAPKISKINQEINKNYDIIETAEKILNESNLSKANSHYHKMSINAAKMEIKKLTIQKEALGSPSMSMETKVAKLKNVKNAPKISKINQEINKNYDIIKTEEKILNESNLSKANSHYHKMSINAAKMEIKKLTIQKEALGSPSMSMETKVAKLKNVKNAPKISKINQEINKDYDIIKTEEKILNESNLSKANSHYHKMSINAAKMEIKKLTIQKEALGSPSMSMEIKVAKLKNVMNAPKISKINQEIEERYDVIKSKEKQLKESNLSRREIRDVSDTIRYNKIEIEDLIAKKNALNGSNYKSQKTKNPLANTLSEIPESAIEPMEMSRSKTITSEAPKRVTSNSDKNPTPKSSISHKQPITKKSSPLNLLKRTIKIIGTLDTTTPMSMKPLINKIGSISKIKKGQNKNIGQIQPQKVIESQTKKQLQTIEQSKKSIVEQSTTKKQLQTEPTTNTERQVITQFQLQTEPTTNTERQVITQFQLQTKPKIKPLQKTKTIEQPKREQSPKEKLKTILRDQPQKPKEKSLLFPIPSEEKNKRRWKKKKTHKSITEFAPVEMPFTRNGYKKKKNQIKKQKKEDYGI